MPSISVVLAVHNGARYIGQAVESILAQSFKDFEFIIVDDGSADNTVAIISSFSDSRINLISNSRNLGQTECLNHGIMRAKAPYIARMDADDIALPDRLQVQFDFLESHPEISVVGSWSADIDANGKELRVHKVPTDPIEIKCYLAGSGDLSLWPITHPTVMMRRQALEKIGLYNTESDLGSGYPQDYDLWSRMVKDFKFANIGKILLKYRILKTSDSRSNDEKQIMTRLKVSRNKISFCVPEMKVDEARALSRMLEWLCLSDSKEGAVIFSLFDVYFKALMGADLSRSCQFLYKLKFYYLPQLFWSNPFLSLKNFFIFICKYPFLLIDIRFYRKVLKSVSMHFFSRENYYRFTRNSLSFR